MELNCYPTLGKDKALHICRAFADGCGGHVVMDGRLRDGPAMFFGVNETNEHIWRAAQADGRDFYYADNAYFDSVRQTYYRVSKNRLQHSGLGTSDGRRFDDLEIEIEPWRTSGAHIVLCPQSDAFMETVVGIPGDRNWTQNTVRALRLLTKRPLVVRGWSPDKKALAATLDEDLENAHALVTWSSAAAVTAVLAGVSAVVMGECAAKPMAGELAAIEHLPTPDGRANWAGVLADNQWTLSEMRAGLAWSAINGSNGR